MFLIALVRSKRGRQAAFVIIKHRCSSCECRPDRQTVSVRPPRTEEQTLMFAPKSSHTQDCSIGRMFPITLVRSKRGRQAAFVRKIVAPASAGQTSKLSLHSSYAEELPHACSIGTKCLTAAVQSKEEKATVFVRKQLLQVPARQASSVCIRPALWSCRLLARLVTHPWQLRCKAKREGDSLCPQACSCKCRPDRQVQFAFILLHQRAAASLLE